MKLTDLITEYVSLKQALGMRFLTEAKFFKSFCRALGDVDIGEVDPSSVEAFLTGKGPITPTWHKKYGILNGLFRFAVNRGYSKTAPLPKTMPRCPDPFLPHIYATDEISRLLAATDSLNTHVNPLQPATFRTLLLTLYGTGLRISEALSLTLADVNLSDRLLIIRESKFFKTRLVPTGPRLTGHLDAYLEKRRRLPRPSGEDSAFFVTRTGHALAYGYVRKVFRTLRDRAGITPRPGARCAPRIHDLRHTAAVHRLEAWYRQGADVQRLLPRLSTYLGHVDVTKTQRYLTMTPDLLREANKRFERYALAEVDHD